MKRKLIPEKGFHELQREWRGDTPGRWIIRYRGQDVATGESKSLRKAWRRGKEIMADLQGLDQDASDVRFKDVAEAIRKEKQKKSKSTGDTYSFILDCHLMPRLGKMKVCKITEADWLEHVRAEKEKGLRKLAHDWRYFREIMRRAHEEGFCKRRLRVENPDPGNEEGREYTDEELTRLRESATPDLRLQIEIAVTSGLTRKETLSLRFEENPDPRSTDGIIELEREEFQLPFKSSKLRRSRVVPINTEWVLPELKRRKLQAGGAYLFPSRNPVTNETDHSRPQLDNKTAWQACKRRAEIEGHFHWLRHTCASRMMRAGFDIDQVVYFLGMSRETLRRVYWHLNREDRANMVNTVKLSEVRAFSIKQAKQNAKLLKLQGDENV